MAPTSSNVNWWNVAEFVAPVLDRVGTWPLIGTIEWYELPDDAPAKIAAVFDAARHWALKVECNQRARDQAGEAISAAEDWSAVAQVNLRRAQWEREHPWARPQPRKDRGAA